MTLGLNAEASGNWKLYDKAGSGSLQSKDGTQWTVPIHFSLSKLTSFGPFPMSLGMSVGVFAAAPNDQPSWRLRLTSTILLPRR